MEHECTMFTSCNGGRGIALACSCGWSGVVTAPTKPMAQCGAANTYAAHVLEPDTQQ